LAGSAPRLRACTLAIHVTLFAGLLALGACRDAKVQAYDVPKEASAELPATKPVHSGAANTAEKQLPPGHPATGAAAVPADVSPAAAMPASPGLQTASGPGLGWTAPATWAAKPASMMRKATYAISAAGATADLAITAFPGDVGGDAANVNRWRGQVGLPPVGDAEAIASIQRITVNGLTVGIVDVCDTTAANPVHLIGAIVPYEGATWFFKLLGPDAVVAPEKAAFLDFIKTVKPAPTAP
jgi:hypothetical protein